MKKVLVVFLIFFAITISLSLSLGLFVKKDLTEFVLNELNHFLRVKIEASEINFHFLKSFPRASLEFKNVIAFPPSDFASDQFSGNGDTVFALKGIRLDFSLPELLRKYYSIHSIQIYEGTLNILVDKSGTPNYLLWKKKETSDESHFFLELKNVRIRDVFFRFKNLVKEVTVENRISSARIQGDFSSSEFMLGLKANGVTGALQIDSLIFPGGIPTSAQMKILVKEGQYQIQGGQLEAGALVLTADGIMEQGPPFTIDFNVRMKNADVHEVYKSLPQEYRNKLGRFFPTGRLSGSVRISGIISPTRSPKVEANFQAQKVRLKIQEKTFLENLAAKVHFSAGSINNLRTAAIQVTETSFSSGRSGFSGSFLLKNFLHPTIRAAITLDAEAKDLGQYFVPDSIVSLEGRIKGNLITSGTLRTLKRLSGRDFADWNFGGSLHLSEGSVLLKKQNILVTDINGIVKPGREVVIKDLSLTSGANKFRIQARIPEFNKWLASEELLTVHAQVYAPSLALTFRSEDKKERAVQEGKGLHFPDSVRLHVDFSFDHLQIGKFEASHVSGMASYAPFMLVLRSVNMETMSGRATGGGAIIQRYNYDFMVRAQCNLSAIDINQLFAGMNSFGQTFITDKHVRGILDGSADVQAEWDNQFHLKPETVLAGASVTISKGELIAFEPLMGLSDFIMVEDLQHVYFATLQNEIYIRDKTVILPTMDIKSSALNISASGEHRFDNTYVYRVRLLLNEILSGKAKRMKKENTEFGMISPEENHKMLLHLVIHGDGKNVKVSYDTKSAFSDIKSRLKNEKETFQTILKEEFSRNRSGNMENGSITGKDGKTASPGIEFDESLQSRPDQERRNLKTQEEKTKFRIEWDEDIPPDSSRKNE